MSKKSDAYSSGMRGNESKKASKVRGVSIDKADNGHIVNVNHEYNGGTPLIDEHKPKLFQDGNENEMVKHVLEALGIKHKAKNDENGEAGDCPLCGK